MTPGASAALPIMAVIAGALVAVAPVGAWSATKVAAPPSPPPPPGQIVHPPAFPYPVYVVPVAPRDDRTPRQRCWDAEAARIGGTLSDLDRRAIDLTCSQR